MRGVAVRADRCLGIGFPYDLVAGHRGLVGFEFLLVALAADGWDLQTPLGALSTALGIDIVRVVTVVAGCIGARLVLPAGPGMN